MRNYSIRIYHFKNYDTDLILVWPKTILDCLNRWCDTHVAIGSVVLMFIHNKHTHRWFCYF